MRHYTGRLLHGLRTADRLARFHAVGFLAIWPLLGAATSGDWSPRTLAGLLAVTLFFNAFGAILNDVIDLPVDRTNPLRARDLLVSGSVTRGQALALASLQVPFVALAHIVAGFPLPALALAAGGLLGMAAYDLWSKSVAIPPLIEGCQALAGSLLVVYGASISGGPLSPVVVPVALSAAAFILFVNAFHGGLRDVENDRACNQQTTPIWLGCTGVVDGRVHIAPLMTLYSGVLQVALIGLAVWTARLLGAGPWGLAAVVAASLLNAALFWAEHRVAKPAWDVLLRTHVAAAAVPVMLAFSPGLGATGTTLLFAVYATPMLLIERSHLSLASASRAALRRAQTSTSR